MLGCFVVSLIIVSIQKVYPLLAAKAAGDQKEEIKHGYIIRNDLYRSS